MPDEGLLWLLARLRERGVVPGDCLFKLSVFAGQASPAGARVAEQLGADTFNPLADLTLPMLSALRAAIRILMDVYLCLVNAMGGFVRLYEAAEIARIAAPCYFKFEPGPSEEEVYAPWNTPAYHAAMIRERVRKPPWRWSSSGARTRRSAARRPGGRPAVPALIRRRVSTSRGAAPPPRCAPGR